MERKPVDASDVVASGGELNDDGEPIATPIEAELRQALEQAFLVGRMQGGAQDLAKVIAAFNERARPIAAASHNPWTKHWSRISTNWLDNEPPKREWLLTRPESKDSKVDVGFFPCGKVGILAAAGGTGKTMALIQLAIAVATGTQWLGHYSTPKSGRVLLALGEEDAEEMQRRLFQAVKALNVSTSARAHVMANIDVLPLAGESVAFVSKDARSGEVLELPAIEQLREQLRAHVNDGQGHEPWRLIILDPLSRFAGPDSETDNSAATRFVQSVESLTKAPGNPAVLLAHHTPKSARGKDTDSLDATVVRGSSALVDGVRWAATLLADSSSDSDATRTATLHLAKSNYTAPAPKHQVKRGDYGVLLPLDDNDQAQAAQQRENTRNATKSSTSERPSNGPKSGGA